MGKEQREYLLRQQLRAIQGELGESNPERAEAQELRDRLIAADLPEEVHKEFERELSRMERLPPAAPRLSDHPHRILELVLELPWREVDRRRSGPGKGPLAGKCSTRDHFDLPRRSRSGSSSIWRFLKLNPKANAPDLVFRGAAGGGQDLARSVDRTLAGTAV